VRILVNAWFVRFARKQRLSHVALAEAVERAETGLIDADLGGGVIKQRVARAGQGRSGGYRTIILYRRAALAVFVYGFAKSERANVDAEEIAAFRAAAVHVLRLSDVQVAALIAKGQFVEVHGDDQKVPE
jgi:hypothetical protein